MLTNLQRQIRAIVAELPEGDAVALAGGSALIATGTVRRGTEDLDFFTAHPEPVTAVLSAFETALAAAGLQVTCLQASQTHARLLVQSDTDTTRVDLATDYRLMAPLRTDEGLILADPELAANKTLALFGRAEPRDYIDFQALTQRFSLTELCDLAASKDGGFTPARLADALAYIEQQPREDFDLDDAAYRDLVTFSKTTATRLDELKRSLDNGGISIS